MAALRSAIRLAFRQSAPASRFLGNAGRRSPASSITSKRNYWHEFQKEDFTDRSGGLNIFLASFGIAVTCLFYHYLRTSGYNSANYAKKSTSGTGHHGQEKAEEKELSEASMSN